MEKNTDNIKNHDRPPQKEEFYNREYYDRLRRKWKKWVNNPQGMFPKELRGLICGAKTRKGTLCKRRDLYASGRCKLHGGLSTGPKTEKGKRRSSMNRQSHSKIKTNPILL